MTPGRITTVLALLLGTGLLTGCDKLTGVADQKDADAEAIGYACRVSDKKPEDCMKENDAFSPEKILDGWKGADQDIKDKIINLGGTKPSAGSAEGRDKPAADTPAEKPAADGAKGDAAKGNAAKKDEAKPAGEQKPADAKGSSR